MFQNEQQIAVIGGGISGLICAYRLLRKGARVTLFEATEDAGGRASSFYFEGRQLDCFGHAVRKSDEKLLDLLRELGLAGELAFTRTTRAVLTEDGYTRIDAPLALLGLDGMSLSGRVRAAWGAYRLSRATAEPKGLDRTTAAAWLTGTFGREMYRKYWLPLLRARFGDKADNVPAQWAWSELRGEIGAAREHRAEFQAGRLTERLIAEIQRHGGIIRLGTPVTAIRDEVDSVGIRAGGRWESFHAAVSTLALPLLRDIADGSIGSQLPRRDLAYRGIVNTVVVLDRPLQKHQSVFLRHKGLPFDGLVETSEAVHLFTHLDAATDAWRQVDADFKFQALKALKALNANFSTGWVEGIEVFRSAHAEPVWDLDARSARPRVRCGITRLYLATPAQCYPCPDDWNAVAGLATDIASRVEFDLRHAPQRELAFAK